MAIFAGVHARSPTLVGKMIRYPRRWREVLENLPRPSGTEAVPADGWGFAITFSWARHLPEL